MRLVTTLTTALTLFTIALPGVNPVFAQESQASERWMTMGKTQKGDILSLNVNSVQTKPHAGNWLWFAYRVTDGVETRERIGFTGACRRGQLVYKPVWNVEIQNRDGVREAIEIKADAPGSLRLLRTVCSKG